MSAIVLLLTSVATLLVATGRTKSLRTGIAVSFAVYGAWIMVTTEILSRWAAIAHWPILLTWIVPGIALPILLRADYVTGIRLASQRCLGIRSGGLLAAAPFGVLGIATLAATLLYPVTNWDSLTYHLPRVTMWLQQQSVEAFASAEPRMLYSSVFSEYAILHIKVLAKGLQNGGADRLVGLVQWLAYIVSVSTVSGISSRIGASRRGQWLAALLAATVPIAVLQASTTQVDLLAAAACLVSVHLLLEFIAWARSAADDVKTARLGTALALGALIGSAAALAVMTKATSFVVLAPFVLLALAALARRAGAAAPGFWRLVVGGVVVSLVVFALVAGPVYLRNASLLDGDFLALSAPSNAKTLTPNRSPASLIGNTVLNKSMLVATPIPALNSMIERSVRSGLSAVGAGKYLAHIDASSWGPYELPHQSNSADFAGSPFTAIAILMGIIATAAQHRTVSRLNRSSCVISPAAYAVTSVTSFALLAALVMWQPWINRLLLGSVLLLIPVAGTLFGERTSAAGAASEAHSPSMPLARVANAAVWSIAAASFVFALLAVSFHASRPLISISPPGSQRSTLSSFWNTPYESRGLTELGGADASVISDTAAAIRATKPSAVCIDQQSGDFFIYPIMAASPRTVFRYINVPGEVRGVGAEAAACGLVLAIIPNTGGRSLDSLAAELDIAPSSVVYGPGSTSRGTVLLYWDAKP